MGGAMLDGFLRSDSFSPSDISISNPHTDRLAPYAEQGVQVSADNRQAAAWGDVVFLVVKPWLVESVIEEISDVLDAQRSYFDAQIGLSNAIRDKQITMVKMYKALGGGW